ncbi:MAG: hypothetical protein ACTHLE_17920 [Agriterribacter sp.]
MALIFCSSHVSSQNSAGMPSGNIGIGTTSPGFKLTVKGNTSIGDDYDPIDYGLLQITRAYSRPDNKFHLSFIQNGWNTAGIGFVPNSTTLGIWHGNNNTGQSLLSLSQDQRVGIGTSTPAEKLTVAGTDGNIFLGPSLFPEGYNGLWLNGSTVSTDYNLLSRAGDKNFYINRPTGATIYFRMSNNTQAVLDYKGNFGIGTSTPAEKLTVAGTDGNIFLGPSLFPEGYNGLWLNGSTVSTDYNLLSRAGDKHLYINRPAGAGIHFRMSNNTQAILTSDGNFGIGTSTPAAKLTVAGTDGNVFLGPSLFPNGYNGLWLNGSTVSTDYNLLSRAGDKHLYINRPAGANIYFRMSNNTQAVLDYNGNVGIGTSNTSDPEYKLFVEAGVRTRKVKVDQAAWPDYVFNDDYNLRPLDEVEHFITANKHLPDVPSAAEVKKDGLNLGDNQAVLLKKIEELTLYIIDQQKQIDDLKKLVQQGQNSTSIQNKHHE